MNELPTDFWAPLLGLGLPGIVIVALGWALVRKDKQVELLQEARVADQKERAQDNLRAAEVIEKLNQAARQREEASDARWRITESMIEMIRQTATETARIGRLIDMTASRSDREQR